MPTRNDSVLSITHPTPDGIYPRKLRPTVVRSEARSDEDRCRPWQHKEDDRCVDDRDVEIHHGPHQPEPTEQCWVVTECLCMGASGQESELRSVFVRRRKDVLQAA